MRPRNLDLPSKAREYVESGYSAIPITSNKRPTVPWKKFQQHIALPHEIDGLFGNGNFGVAIVGGRVSGDLEAIDIDCKYDGTGQLWDSFNSRIRETNPDLASRLVIASTPNHGFHILYKCQAVARNQKLAQRPATADEAANGERVKVLIETRGEGGYIAVAPTLGYSFVQGNLGSVQTITPEERESLFTIARSFDQLPQSNSARPTSKSSNVSPFDDYNLRADIPSLLTSHGWRAARRDGENQYFLRPGKQDGTSASFHEKLRTFYVFSTSTEFEAERAYSPSGVYTVLEHGGDFAAAARALRISGFGNETPDDSGRDQSDWADQIPRPLPDELLPVPEFDPNLLPKSLRAFIVDIAERMQAPIEYVAAIVVVGAASIVGNTARIAPKLHDDWTIPPNLWGLIVAKPGKLKTPALQAGLELVKKREAAARQDYEKELRSFTFLKFEREAALDAVKGKIRQAAKSGKDTKAFRDEFENAASIEEPHPKTYVVNDATYEKLGVLLNRNSRGLLQFRDELGGWLRHLEKDENAEEKSFILECWSGYGSYVFERIGRGEVRIENLTLSLFGGIQPSILASLLRDVISGHRPDDGLLQRFQISFYPDPKQWELVDRPPDLDGAALANECFARLDTMCQNDRSKTFHFTSEAQEFFYQWWRDLEAKIDIEDFDHPVIASHFAKFRSLMPSLALIFHLLDYVSGAAERNTLDLVQLPDVSLDAAKRAAGWTDLLGEHALRIYGIAIREEIALAKTILRRIRKGMLGLKFTARKLYRHGWTGLKSPQNCTAPLELLVEHGYLYAATVGPSDLGGQPTTVYYPHPSVLADDRPL